MVFQALKKSWVGLTGDAMGHPYGLAIEPNPADCPGYPHYLVVDNSLLQRTKLICGGLDPLQYQHHCI